MRAKDGDILFKHFHLNRFRNSCNYFDFTFDDDITKIATELLQLNQLKDAFVWMACWRGTPESGSPRETKVPQHKLIYVKPYYGINDNGLKLCIDNNNRRTPDVCHNQEYKNFGWIEFNLAQRTAVKNNFDSVVLLSVDGYITEGPGFSICFIKNGTVYTPRKDCLRSVTVDVVEILWPYFVRKDITPEEALDADEAFICSTSGGITPVNQLNDKNYTHKLTNELKDRYDKHR